MANQHKSGSLEGRFWPKVDKGPHPKGCWLWTACLNPAGYGRIGIGAAGGGGSIRAHRASYIFAHGSIPKGMHVLHKCDTSACVNPAHLEAGTDADNMRQMVERGRDKRAGGPSKMGGVEEIAALRAEGMNWTTIGSIYGLTPGAAWDYYHRQKGILT